MGKLKILLYPFGVTAEIIALLIAAFLSIINPDAALKIVERAQQLPDFSWYTSRQTPNARDASNTQEK